MSYDRPDSLRRRDFLAGAAVGVAGGGALAWAAWEAWSRRASAERLAAEAAIAFSHENLALPGPLALDGHTFQPPLRGRVVEVHHPGAVLNTKRDRAAIRQMIAVGMRSLFGTDHSIEAWKLLFKPGDRVGIKVVPVGQPHSISSYEVVLEVIAGLQSAGVRLRDILVFDRYKHDFVTAGYHQIVPDGAHWECSSAVYDNAQLELDGQVPGTVRESRVAGYDRDVYRALSYCDPDSKTHDPQDDRRFRSHLSKIITQKVDKFISIPVLKDHRSAGVTLSLKNLSHGSVNNVARSHITNAALAYASNQDGRGAALGTLNQCQEFIPAMVGLPAIREKAVLQILDGLVATYEGGPGTWNRTFATWEHNSLFFATDPVAIDRIGWETIDRQRVSRGLPPIAAMGLDAATGVIDVDGLPYPEQFHIRQPQHVPLAATLGLGTFERAAIDYRRIELPAKPRPSSRA